MTATRAAKTRTKAKATEADVVMHGLITQITEDRFGPGHVSRCREKFADLSDEQFVGFMRKAFEIGADPLDGALYYRVQEGFNGGKRLSVMATITAMRSFAERQGDYAADNLPMVLVRDPDYRPGPGEEVSYVQYDRAVECETNPHGIVSCTLAVYRYLHGSWRRHSATVSWADYVPVFNGQIANEAWANIPLVMIAKVAEAAAFRKAYPALGAIYVPEEMERSSVEADPSRAIPVVTRATPSTRAATSPIRIEAPVAPPVAPARPVAPEPSRRRGPGAIVDMRDMPKAACEDIPVDFGDGEGPVGVPEDEFGMRIREFLADKMNTRNYQAVLDWFENNAPARRKFYVYDARHNHVNAHQIGNFQDQAERKLKHRNEQAARRSGGRQRPSAGGGAFH